jgi:hypothetical protein
VKRWQKVLSYCATGVASFVLAGFAIAQTEPTWWAAVIGVVPALIAVVIGKPWKVPEA